MTNKRAVIKNLTEVSSDLYRILWLNMPKGAGTVQISYDGEEPDAEPETAIKLYDGVEDYYIMIKKGEK